MAKKASQRRERRGWEKRAGKQRWKMGLGLGAGGTLSIETEEASGHHMVQGFPGQAKSLRLSPLGHESHRRDGQDPSDTRSLSRSISSKPSPRAHTPQAQLPMLGCRHSKRAKRVTTLGGSGFTM